MKAKSIKGKSPEEISARLTESMADGFKPTLALVFISVKQDIASIISILDRKNIQIFGATTGGEISGSDISHEAISILLMDRRRRWHGPAARDDSDAVGGAGR